MTRYQHLISRQAKIRRRKEWLANATLAIFIVALAGCQNSQRWSQPGATPSDQYFVPSTSSSGAPAASSAIPVSAPTGQAQSWNAATTTTPESGSPWSAPGYLESVASLRTDVGAPERAGEAGGDGGGRDTDR